MNLSSVIPLGVGRGRYTQGKNYHLNFKQKSEQCNYTRNKTRILPQNGEFPDPTTFLINLWV